MVKIPAPGAVTCGSLAKIANCRVRLIYNDCRIGMFSEHPEYKGVVVTKVEPARALPFAKWSEMILDAYVEDKV